jgi:hypothetical protein
MVSRWRPRAPDSGSEWAECRRTNDSLSLTNNQAPRPTPSPTGNPPTRSRQTPCHWLPRPPGPSGQVQIIMIVKRPLAAAAPEYRLHRDRYGEFVQQSQRRCGTTWIAAELAKEIVIDDNTGVQLRPQATTALASCISGTEKKKKNQSNRTLQLDGLVDRLIHLGHGAGCTAACLGSAGLTTLLLPLDGSLALFVQL